MPDPSSGEAHKGGCACGEIRFEASGPLDGVIYCHCSQCRRQTGHFVAATRVLVEDMTVTKGEDDLTWFRSSDKASRAFCRICGSGLFYQAEGGPRISIMAGALDLPTGLVAREHIYTRDQGDYYWIDDGLPQKEGG